MKHGNNYFHGSDPHGVSLDRNNFRQMAGLDHDDWRVRAECAGRDPELWFDADPSSVATQIALAACKVCLVRRDCYLTAVRLRESAGIWGGVNFGKKGSPA
jgi:hypothetical protein